MFYHYQSIPQIPQVLQGIQQFVIVSLVQADAGLIQNIAYTHQSGTDLGCQTDTLCLTAGQGSRSSGQRQIFQSHIHQESYSCADLLQTLSPMNCCCFVSVMVSKNFFRSRMDMEVIS